MRTAILVIALLLPVALAQHGESHEEQAGEHHDNTTLWKWANFAVLAGALGYGISKSAGAFFHGRTAQIRQGIEEAALIRKEADEKAAAMEQRMANLGSEIERQRTKAREEIAAEGERMKKETEQLLTKARANAEQEIAAAAKAASKELKAQAAQLALDLARQRIRKQLTPEVDAALVHSFADHLRSADGRMN